MLDSELKNYIGKEISIFVRYGFKKRVEETQSYDGKLISVDKFGIIIERKISETDSLLKEFFPWHNIEALRYRQIK